MAKWTYRKEGEKPKTELVKLLEKLVSLIREAHENQTKKQLTEIKKLIELEKVKRKNG